MLSKVLNVFLKNKQWFGDGFILDTEEQFPTDHKNRIKNKKKVKK